LIGLDTNVLIRYIVQDDEHQAKLATAFIESHCSAENPAFINEITLCEVVWVLKRAYRYDKAIILNVLKQLLNSNDLQLASYQAVVLAYGDYEHGKADFSDYLIGRINQKSGCQVTVTFDKKAGDGQGFKFLDEL
jgi:predicted nucleic-acid-binding protein